MAGFIFFTIVLLIKLRVLLFLDGRVFTTTLIDARAYLAYIYNLQYETTSVASDPAFYKLLRGLHYSSP